MSLTASTQAVINPITGGRDTQAADLGNFFVAVTPTPGTGIITGNPTSFDETKPLLTVFNGGTLNIYPVYLRLMSTVVGGGAATKNFTHVLDQGNRYSSGGTALVPSNTNSLSSTRSSASLVTGAITATAASSNRRILGNNFFRVSVADIVGDIYDFSYGGPVQNATQQIATAVHFTRSVAPICIQPQSTYALYVWSGTFTQGITFEVEFGYIEK